MKTGSTPRRGFLKEGALALVGTAAIPAFLRRSVLAEATSAAASKKKLVVLFQRGAVDGLNMVVPYQEQNYHAMRPTIAIPQKEVVDLDGFFGLHPAMASLKPLYAQGHLAVVHAAGSPDMSRSHFDAQDYMESGTPGVKSTPDGWLNRALLNQKPSAVPSPFRAVALGSQVPRTLQGTVPAIAMSNIRNFSIDGGGSKDSSINVFEQMYATNSNSILHGTGQETFAAMRMFRAADPAKYRAAPGVLYPLTEFGRGLAQIAQLLKADLGVEAAFSDIGGWDTHQNQGGTQGQLANRLHDFSDSIAAFWEDMGDDAGSITLVTMSEFGRTARQNGTGGTDHGHANAMFVLGGQVRGGKVYGSWPGLQPEHLNEGRDLAVTTDFRQVLGEAVSSALGVHSLKRVFPGDHLKTSKSLGILA